MVEEKPAAPAVVPPAPEPVAPPVSDAAPAIQQVETQVPSSSSSGDQASLTPGNEVDAPPAVPLADSLSDSSSTQSPPGVEPKTVAQENLSAPRPDVASPVKRSSVKRSSVKRSSALSLPRAAARRGAVAGRPPLIPPPAALRNVFQNEAPAGASAVCPLYRPRWTRPLPQKWPKFPRKDRSMRPLRTCRERLSRRLSGRWCLSLPRRLSVKTSIGLQSLKSHRRSLGVPLSVVAVFLAYLAGATGSRARAALAGDDSPVQSSGKATPNLSGSASDDTGRDGGATGRNTVAKPRGETTAPQPATGGLPGQNSSRRSGRTSIQTSDPSTSSNSSGPVVSRETAAASSSTSGKKHPGFRRAVLGRLFVPCPLQLDPCARGPGGLRASPCLEGWLRVRVLRILGV